MGSLDLGFPRSVAGIVSDLSHSVSALWFMAQVKGLFSLFLNSDLIQKSELLSQNNLIQRDNKTQLDQLKLL